MHVNSLLKATFRKVMPEGVSLMHIPPSLETTRLDSFVYFRNIVTSLGTLALLLASAPTHCSDRVRCRTFPTQL